MELQFSNIIDLFKKNVFFASLCIIIYNVQLFVKKFYLKVQTNICGQVQECDFNTLTKYL